MFKRADDSVYVVAPNVPVLKYPPSRLAQAGKRHGLIDKKPQFVFVLERNEVVYFAKVPTIYVDALHNQKPPRHFGSLGVLAE